MLLELSFTIQTVLTSNKPVVTLNEVSWISFNRSGFLKALKWPAQREKKQMDSQLCNFILIMPILAILIKFPYGVAVTKSLLDAINNSSEVQEPQDDSR